MRRIGAGALYRGFDLLADIDEACDLITAGDAAKRL